MLRTLACSFLLVLGCKPTPALRHAAPVAAAPAPREAATAPPGALPPAAVEPAPAESLALSGTWSGTYIYGASTRPEASAASVSFFVELVVERGRLHGTVVEPNTFGDDSTGELHATLRGTVDGDGMVRFTKHYDGTGGVLHDVAYVGRLDLAAARIEGTWSTGGISGRFVMKRDSPLPQLASRGRAHG